MRSGLFVLTALLATGCRFNFDPIVGDGADDDAGTTQLRLKRFDIGARHVCGLTNDGALYCWGDNTYGQVGIPLTEALAAEPRRVTTDVWTDLSVGDEHTCGLLEGAPYCWGSDMGHQIDGQNGTSFPTPTRPPLGAAAPLTYERIFAGGEASCVLQSGVLRCWGRPLLLGNGNVDMPMATQVPGSDWMDLAIGYDHACGISASQGLMCWGDTSQGEAGIVSATPLATPAAVSLPMTPLSVNTGQSVTCTILGAAGATTGALWCFGSNDQGTLEMPPSPSSAPHQMGTSSKWSAVSIGDASICGIDDGRAKCWGSSSESAIGNGIFGNYAVTVENAADLGPADTIVVSKNNVNLPAIARTVCKQTGDQLTCWGQNLDGQFGNGTFSLHRTPTPVAHPMNKPWRKVIAASDHACATDEDGAMYCWGGDYYMQITATDGHGYYTPCVAGGTCDRVRPTLAPAEAQTAAHVGTNYSATCAQKGMTISCWGDRDGDNLGIQNPSGNGPSEVPSQTPGQWIGVSGGMYGMCGNDDFGNLQCWGTVAGVQQPVTHLSNPGYQNSMGASFGSQFGCATNTTTSSRVCWGDNSLAQLGVGNQVAQVGVRVLDMGITAAVSVAGNTGCMLDTTGHVLCWGDNGHSQAGGPSQSAPVLSPTRIRNSQGDLANCSKVSIAEFHSCAICSGAPVCWGRNVHGALGRGTIGGGDPVAAPVNVPAGTYVDLATLQEGGCAVEVSGTLYCWGEGVHGSMGDGSSGSPYPVPAATVLP